MNNKYDVFISSKSEDYCFAEEVYSFLKRNGLSVFVASKDLDKIGEAEYADAIDSALDSTKHMIVVASSVANINSKWVHYEWSTFSNDLRSGYREGNLLTVLRDVSLRYLPPALRHQQSFNYETFKDGRILGYLKPFGISSSRIEEFSLSSNMNDPNFHTKENDADSLYELGIEYLNGDKVEQSFTKARFYLEKAAIMNHVQAQIVLGDMYYEEKYGNPRIKKAFEWYSRALRLADEEKYVDTHLLYRLGYMYIHHEGVGWSQKNTDMGLSLLLQAVEQPKECIDREAAFELGQYFNMINSSKARKYFIIAKEMGHPKAQNALRLLDFREQKYAFKLKQS